MALHYVWLWQISWQNTDISLTTPETCQASDNAFPTDYIAVDKIYIFQRYRCISVSYCNWVCINRRAPAIVSLSEGDHLSFHVYSKVQKMKVHKTGLNAYVQPSNGAQCPVGRLSIDVQCNNRMGWLISCHFSNTLLRIKLKRALEIIMHLTNLVIHLNVYNRSKFSLTNDWALPGYAAITGHRSAHGTVRTRH